MKAAVVNTFGKPPAYQDFPDPVADAGSGAEVVEVTAAGLHPRVRSGASGRHYTSTGVLPMVPGVDGVGRRADGRLIYFLAEDNVAGTMADRALVAPGRSVELPDDVDQARLAASMNPAMSSWVALRRRVPLRPGQGVLILGATGNAGSVAVDVARLLGAGQVIGAGRNPARLAELAGRVDQAVALTDDPVGTAQALGQAAAEVDVVIDYLWGPPALAAMEAILRSRADRARPLDWIQIGAVAGPAIELPSAFLRSANLRLQGSGQGSVGAGDYRAELEPLVAEIDAGRIGVAARTAPLADVAAVWDGPDKPGMRTVFVP